MGILDILIISALVLFPLGELVRISIVKDITLHPVDISVFLVSLAWLIIQVKNKKNILRIVNIKPILLFILICLFSLILNSYWLKQNELLAAGLYLLRWLSYAGVYFAVRDSKNKLAHKLLKLILIMYGLFIIAVGFLQILLFPSLVGLERYQWDRHMYRIVSIFLDPNFAGAFFVLFLIFIMANFFEYFAKKKYLLTVLFGIISAITLLAIYFTFSRSALLMLITSASVFLFLIKRKKYLFILLISTALYVIILSPKFYIENLNLFRVTSSIQRIESSKTAIEIIKRNPIFGVGFDAYRYAKDRYGFDPSNTTFSSHADGGTDNSFLLITATSGVIGLIAYINLWFQILKKFYFKNKKPYHYFASCVIASSLGLCINAMFINSLFFGTFMLWMWVLIGFTDSELH